MKIQKKNFFFFLGGGLGWGGVGLGGGSGWGGQGGWERRIEAFVKLKKNNLGGVWSGGGGSGWM